jgi:hypothetical protein
MPDVARRKLLRSRAVQEAAPEVVAWLKALLYRGEQDGEPAPEAKQASNRPRKKTAAIVHAQK